MVGSYTNVQRWSRIKARVGSKGLPASVAEVPPLVCVCISLACYKESEKMQSQHCDIDANKEQILLHRVLRAGWKQQSLHLLSWIGKSVTVAEPRP